MSDLISRQAAIECCRNEWEEEAAERIKQLPPVSVAEKTDAYKQGWHDAIGKALKEAYTIHHYGDIFRVVQEETLIGVGMAFEKQESEDAE